MYLCVCKNISQKQIDEAVKSNGPSVQEVSRGCGAGTDCGACLERLQKYIEQSAKPRLKVAK